MAPPRGHRSPRSSPVVVGLLSFILLLGAPFAAQAGRQHELKGGLLEVAVQPLESRHLGAQDQCVNAAKATSANKGALQLTNTAFQILTIASKFGPGNPFVIMIFKTVINLFWPTVSTPSSSMCSWFSIKAYVEEYVKAYVEQQRVRDVVSAVEQRLSGITNVMGDYIDSGESVPDSWRYMLNSMANNYVQVFDSSVPPASLTAYCAQWGTMHIGMLVENVQNYTKRNGAADTDSAYAKSRLQKYINAYSGFLEQERSTLRDTTKVQVTVDEKKVTFRSGINNWLVPIYTVESTIIGYPVKIVIAAGGSYLTGSISVGQYCTKDLYCFDRYSKYYVGWGMPAQSTNGGYFLAPADAARIAGHYHTSLFDLLVRWPRVKHILMSDIKESWKCLSLDESVNPGFKLRPVKSDHWFHPYIGGSMFVNKSTVDLVPPFDSHDLHDPSVLKTHVTNPGQYNLTEIRLWYKSGGEWNGHLAALQLGWKKDDGSMFYSKVAGQSDTKNAQYSSITMDSDERVVSIRGQFSPTWFTALELKTSKGKVIGTKNMDSVKDWKDGSSFKLEWVDEEPVYLWGISVYESEARTVSWSSSLYGKTKMPAGNIVGLRLLMHYDRLTAKAV